jgi:Rrf2 family protein
MRLGEGVEWALHCTTFLAALPPDRPLPAARLAEFHGVPTAYLAKQLQALARAGIVESAPGRRGGYRLARPATSITLLDVVEAVEGTEPAFSCTEIRQRGPAALDESVYRTHCSIARAMWAAEARWRIELESRTIADVVKGLSKDVPAVAAVKAAAWFQEVTG